MSMSMSMSIAWRWQIPGRELWLVMPGLDPGIHDASRLAIALRKTDIAGRLHRLPGQARQ